MDNMKDKSLVINQAQLVLADKRTNLATLRTGIAVMALPMGVLSFLIAVSKDYSVGEVAHYLIPLLVLSGALALVGMYLIIRAVLRYHHNRLVLDKLEKKYHLLADLLE